MSNTKRQARAFYFNLVSISDTAVREGCVSISKLASRRTFLQGKKISKKVKLTLSVL